MSRPFIAPPEIPSAQAAILAQACRRMPTRITCGRRRTCSSTSARSRAPSCRT
jgi:hypothetical protein